MSLFEEEFTDLDLLKSSDLDPCSKRHKADSHKSWNIIHGSKFMMCFWYRDRRLFPASALVLRRRKKRGKFRVAMFNRIGKNVWELYHVRFHKSHKMFSWTKFGCKSTWWLSNVWNMYQWENECGTATKSIVQSAQDSRALNLYIVTGWIPSKPKSHSAAKYVVTFIDIYSRYTVACSIESKSEVCVE